VVLTFYFTANTQTAPPCGTSGYLPGKSKLRRPCMRAEPRPIPLNRDELPTLNFVRYRDPGDARTYGDLPQDLPALASNARNKRSFVPTGHRRSQAPVPSFATSRACWSSTRPAINIPRLQFANVIGAGHLVAAHPFAETRKAKTYWQLIESSALLNFEVPKRIRRAMIRTSNSPHSSHATGCKAEGDRHG
jgi:hypothetical protein